MTLQPQTSPESIDQSRAALNAAIAAALDAANPAVALRRHVQRDGASLVIADARVALPGRDIHVIGAGKAAAAMCAALLPLLDGARISGVVVTKYGHAAGYDCGPLTVIEAGHPVPDANSQRGGDAVCAALRDCTPDTTVLACVSGGASALLVTPQPGITLRTIAAINDALLRSGADITEMNAVRARVDRLKAGGLVRLAQPAQVHGLILSDVVGDPLGVIASGLTHDAAAHNTLVGNNAQSCDAACTALVARGFAARIVTTELRGEARDVGARIAAEIMATAPGSALIYGGETTVTLRGAGAGGRNQELALAAALALPSGSGCHVASLGTDGTDGPTDAAGAIAHPDTISRAAALGLNAASHLANNDSYPFFDALGDLIHTGPTGTNVADVVIALRDRDVI
jgi:hydroxypyruvate reductase